MPIMVGSTDYFGVPFPLVLGDRFFHVPKNSFGFNLDIIRWDSESRHHVYEVLNGRPVISNITWNPNATVTFKQITPKLFIYKFLPKTGIMQISGKTPINQEFVVRIDENEITVTLKNVTLVAFKKYQVEGPIGLKVNVDGSYVLGISQLPDGMILKRGYLAKT
jgi:hypothetical protein